jgi:hypothetical protein
MTTRNGGYQPPNDFAAGSRGYGKMLWLRMRNETNTTWILIAVGCFLLLATLYNLYSGRMTVTRRHRWGFNYSFDVQRDAAPFVFWAQMFLQILIGGGILGYGIQRLVEGP